MNEGQQKFLGFILDRVQEDKKEEAKTLLQENFKKQVAGTFNKEDAMGFMPKMMSLLKIEHVEEVKAVVMEFGRKFQ